MLRSTKILHACSFKRKHLKTINVYTSFTVWWEIKQNTEVHLASLTSSYNHENNNGTHIWKRQDFLFSRLFLRNHKIIAKCTKKSVVMILFLPWRLSCAINACDTKMTVTLCAHWIQDYLLPTNYCTQCIKVIHLK